MPGRGTERKLSWLIRGQTLKRLRKEHTWMNQTELAAELGLLRDRFGRYEQGSADVGEWSINRFRKFAEVLNMDVQDVLDELGFLD